MSDPFDFPERDLPESVKQAAYRRIMTEIGDTRPRRRTGLAPLLIAASVIALVAGATIVTSTLNNKDNQAATAAPPSHPSTTTSAPGRTPYNAQRNWGAGPEMDRCWSASQKSDAWTPLLHVDNEGLGLTALLYRVGTDLVFCELTKETVTVKAVPYPDPPSGNQPAKILFATVDGTYAGVTAPGVRDLTIDMGVSQQVAPAAVAGGVFIVPNTFRLTDHVWLRGNTTGYPGYNVPKADLPQPLTPSLTLQDPKDERTSAGGQRLASCLPVANPPVVDADWMTPGAYVKVDDTHEMQMGRTGTTVAACQLNQGQVTVDGPLNFVYVGKSGGFTTKISKADNGPAGFYLVGIIVDPTATTVGLTMHNGPEVTGTVVDGTVIVYSPDPPDPQGITSIKVKSADGAVIEQIPLG